MDKNIAQKTGQPAPAAQSVPTTPVAPTATTAPVSEPVSKTQTKSKIMIVEDDPILLRMYTEKLSFEGYVVVSAKNGEDALKVAQEQKPDLIILDIMLPRMSGTDFLERFRKEEKNKQIPVIALTNLAEEEERQKAIALGAKEYLVKAMQTPEQVLEKVKKYVN